MISSKKIKNNEIQQLFDRLIIKFNFLNIVVNRYTFSFIKKL